MATLPYRTDEEVRAAYNQLYNTHKNNLTAQANQQKAARNSEYDSAQQANYVASMQNRRELPQTLAQQGITGGAAETSLLRAQTNYENNYNNTERARSSALNSIDTELTNSLNSYKAQADANLNAELASERQKRASYEQALQEQAENRYAKTISGWNTVGGIDKEIAAIRKSGKDTWRIAYLRARRAELLEQQAAASSGGSGGGSYRSSGGSGGSGGTTDTSGVSKLTSAAAKGVTGATASALKKVISASKKSTAKKSTKKTPTKTTKSLYPNYYRWR